MIYNIFLLICLLIYTIFLVLTTLFICINSFKLKKKYGIDNIIVFMSVYLLNFMIDVAIFPIFPYYLLQIFHTFLIILIVSKCSNLQIIGLTGGIACGKSTVCNIIKKTYNLEIIDCDVLARVIVQPGKPAYNKIVKLFGNEILVNKGETLVNAEIDRAKLGELVFSNKLLRNKLTKITSMYIMLEILKELYKVFYILKKKEVLLDAPILFESKYLQFICFPIILIYVTEENIQIKRLKERNGLDEEQAINRIKSQMPIKAKIKKSDVLINNEGSIDELQSKIIKNLPLFLI